MKEKNDILRLTARMIRFGVVFRFFKDGEITEDQAKEILSGRLDPDNPETQVDDTRYLQFDNMEDVFQAMKAEIT